ncbi:DUF4349 domain-containing protein [Treponema sp.]|uniref:DUF4349 domain-containing protein n=1 Tax=Treponema sp. TaxID=166 RepID=UPI00298DECEE|nr:DUF4349 domain-containing protein [Treponema sp.]MCR5613493.1 DUF4349 domain-containing protein [Treponema sp.]
MKKILYVCAAVSVLFVLGSCGAKSARKNEAPALNSLGETKMMKMKDSGRNASDVVFESDMMLEEQSDSESTGQNEIVERKLIKNGSVLLEADSLADLEKKADEFSKKYGGYITSSSTGERDFYCTVKIPCEKFEQAMNEAGDFGKVIDRSQDSRDVTDEFYDLNSRINTKKILKKKLEGYLSTAKDIKDLLEIERQLNNVITELESMEGRMKRLSNQIDYSTLSIHVRLPFDKNENGFVWPDMGEGFRNFAVNVVEFFAGFVLFLFYFVAYGVPIVALIALLFWLLFGRVGLLIKLFNKLRGKKD